MTRLLITGGSGRVARQLLPALADHDLRLLDRTPPGEDDGSAAGAEVIVGDLTDRAVLAQALDGVDAVVHLAGDPRPDAPWDDLEKPNVDGFVALLGAAVRAQVTRVVFASSVHAMGRYEAEGRTPIDPAWPTAPCCVYGATKAFDEAAASVVAYRTGLSCVGLRLGATVPEPTEVGQLPGWLGPADLHRLVRSALAADVGFAVVPGISANTRHRWDLTNAVAYQPELDSEEFAGSVADGPDVTTCPAP